MRFHAVMIGEDRMEFGVDIEADSYESARRQLREDYPGSRCVQLETPADAAEREQRLYRELLDEDFDSEDDGWD